ncbi:MAG: hypothetical protein QM744_04285 [Mesorhizobium sp.]
MKHNIFRGLLLLGGTLSLSLPVLAQHADADLVARATRIHDSHPNLDDHLDIPFDYGSGELDAGLDGPAQFDLPKAKRGQAGRMRRWRAG